MTGRLIAIEGPDGVGKTTVTRALVQRMNDDGEAVHMTTEPTDTPLGRLLRSSEGSISGRAFALALAADRTLHVEREIAPRLASGTVVITDRYIHSSLVLQQIDGLPLDDIWTYNAHILPAAVSFILTESPAIIVDRLSRRDRRSRLEEGGSPAQQADLYVEAYDFLQARGWRQQRIDCHGRSPADIAAGMAACLRNMLD